MILEILPIDLFIRRIMQDPEVGKIWGDWPVEEDVLRTMLVKHFEEMGIFDVRPGPYSNSIKEQLMVVLTMSPEIRTLLDKERSRAEEAKEKQRFVEEA